MRTTIGVAILSIAGLAGCASSGANDNPAPPPPEQVTTRISTTGVSGASGTSGMSEMTLSSTPNLGVVTLDATPAKVWTELVGVYGELGIELAVLEQKRGLLGNPQLKVRRRLGTVPLTRYINCGSTQGAQSAETYEIVLNVQSQLHSPSPNSTTVTTIFQSMGRPVSMASEYRTCSSTGALEKRIEQLLRTRLSG